MSTHCLRAPALLAMVWLVVGPVYGAQKDAAPSAGPQRVPLKPGQERTNIALENYYSPDRSLRVQYACFDENLPGGASEGASNPANVQCMASLFLMKSGDWVFADDLRLGQGSVKKFAGYQLTVETVNYGMGDALCCPSKVATLVFDVRAGKFEEDLAAEGKPYLIKALEDGAETPQIAALLARGANVNAYDATGRTPLMLATELENTATVQLLLERGAQVNLQRTDGRTALMLAVEENSPDIVRLLLAHSANANVRTKGGDTPLNAAAARANLEVMAMLLDHDAKANAPDTDGITPLIGAVRTRSAAMARLLLEHGADPNLAAADGTTPLMAASAGGYPVIIELLAAKRANLNIGDAQGRTPLFLSILQGRADTAQLLLQAGADPNARDKAGRTPLIAVAAAGPQLSVAKTGELITLLLAHGADINAQDTDGSNALMKLVYVQAENSPGPTATPPPALAAQGDAPTPFVTRMDLIRLLIDKGADLDAMDRRGKTILAWYAERDCAMVRELLGKGGGAHMDDPASALVSAIYGGHDDCLRAMLDHGFDANRRTQSQYTALAAAASTGHMETVKLLLAHGADPSMKAGWGEIARTPADIARSNGHPDIAQLLQPLTHATPPPHEPPMARSDMMKIALVAAALAAGGALAIRRRRPKPGTPGR